MPPGRCGISTTHGTPRVYRTRSTDGRPTQRVLHKGHELDPHRVPPDSRWKGVSKSFVYPNECNLRAGKFLLSNFGHASQRDSTLVRLVHGYYSPPDLSFTTQHAWVDLGTGIVFDGVLQGFYVASGYAEVYRTEEVVRYTLLEAARMLREHGHWGPWHPAVRSH